MRQKMNITLHTLLLAGVAPALSLADEASTVTPEADWFGAQSPAVDAAVPADQAAAKAARVLADRMAYVCDRATADAAAADIAPLVAQLTAQGGEETFWTRMHMAYTDCYGSPELKAVFAPLLPPADTATNPDFEASLPVLMEVWRTLEDVATTLRGVQDKATADAAAETVSLFAEHLNECMEMGNSVPAPPGNRMDLVIFFYSGEYIRSGALYKEWGELQNRSIDYYGSQLLAEAMENLSGAMENLDQPADPYAIGQMVLICPQMEEQMRQALAITAGIRDRATADAAAPQLQACVDRMQAAAAPLGRGYEKDLGHVSPMFLFLTLSCDRLLQRLKRVDYYGSDALRAFVEHK